MSPLYNMKLLNILYRLPFFKAPQNVEPSPQKNDVLIREDGRQSVVLEYLGKHRIRHKVRDSHGDILLVDFVPDASISGWKCSTCGAPAKIARMRNSHDQDGKCDDPPNLWKEFDYSHELLNH